MITFTQEVNPKSTPKQKKENVLDQHVTWYNDINLQNKHLFSSSGYVHLSNTHNFKKINNVWAKKSCLQIHLDSNWLLVSTKYVKNIDEYGQDAALSKLC